MQPLRDTDIIYKDSGSAYCKKHDNKGKIISQLGLVSGRWNFLEGVDSYHQMSRPTNYTVIPITWRLYQNYTELMNHITFQKS